MLLTLLISPLFSAHGTYVSKGVVAQEVLQGVWLSEGFISNHKLGSLLPPLCAQQSGKVLVLAQPASNSCFLAVDDTCLSIHEICNNTWSNFFM